ncbi:MAG TPA: family 43 glycosylhydrolase [Clostridiaceae bacterium]|nr:family 43 glycosylhydrolase [Clostridiaceae bacterium]
MYNSIRPGKPWKDTDGNLIQAHGGSILYHNGTYYWYGENKEKNDATNKIWHYGVRCYSSKDLYNWKSEGIILEPSEDLKSPLHPCRIMDRPHIVYNRFTKQFVMWVKFAGTEKDHRKWEVQYMGIAVSDDITKPFKLIKTIRPLGMETGDFDLYVDPRDGKGYFIFDRVHTEIVIADLTSDYLDVTGYYSSHFPHEGPPTAREAPCFFKRKDKYYIITSGTTGYFPNRSEVAMAQLMHGPYTVFKNLCVNDTKKTSFDCQFSSVFKHPQRKDLYIAVGDRWYQKGVEINGRLEPDTSEAGYVWLPIMFHDNIPFIVWRDEWRIEDFELCEEEKPKWLTEIIFEE